MNVSMTVIGQWMIVFIIVVGVLSYILGRRKTTTPIIAGIIGAVLALIPPLGMIYLVILLLKKDVQRTS